MITFFMQPACISTEARGENVKSMTFYERAFRYIQRKRSQSILLLVCFFIISVTILSATMILQSAQATNFSIREKTGTKLVLRSESGISADTIVQIQGISSVSKINGTVSNAAFPVGFSPVIKKDGTEPLNMAVSLHAYDNTEMDGLFAEEKYRLLDGIHITENQSGILVNSILADANGLSIGDSLSFQTEDEKTAAGKIIGIFFSGSEREQENNVTAAYRIENQIFVDHKLFQQLYGVREMDAVSVYIADPEKLDELQTQIESLVDDSVSITASDALYKQMQAPLKQVIRITSLMLILTVITAVIVISLLLCMWTRTRIKETAVLISLGVSKISMLLQELTESLVLFILSVMGATAFGILFAGQLTSALFSASDFVSLANIHLEIKHVLTLLLLGSGIVFVAVGISIYPILRANPRDTLSRMEG